MRKYIVLNWKMAPSSLKEARVLFQILRQNKSSLRVIVIPPFIYLESALKLLSQKYFLGAQDVFWQNRAYATGEISPKMLKSMGVKYVIVGHSERRHYFKETDEMINLKIKACLENGLVPILCIGEKERKEKESCLSFHIKKTLFEQLNKALSGVNLKKKESLVIAYEPVWAIGSNLPETVESAEEVLKLIRFWLLRRFPESLAKSISLLYGGSVRGKNIKNYLCSKIINGVLVGSASTNKKELIKILNSKF